MDSDTGTFRPRDETEAAAVIAWAAAEDRPLDITAGGSKRALGRPWEAAHQLDVSALSGVIDYDPAELVLTARAATPMHAIDALLAEQAQMLAFEPPDWRALLGSVATEPTLGGVIACNQAGPRRVRAGAARDHFLGLSAINGWGDAWKAGGRVVKNVTGYDMGKLQAGAFGTLSLLTQLSVRVLPRPETCAGVLLSGLSDAQGVAAMARALNTPHEVSAAAHLPADIARRCGLAATASVTALRIEGHAPSVAFRADALAETFGAAATLGAAATRSLWTEIAGVATLLPPTGRHIWRLCPAPSAAPAIVQAVRARLPSAEAFYDWGGGLVWLSLDPADAGADAGAACVRSGLRAGGGHATLVVAPDDVRATVAVFEPEAGALAALSARVKDGFDPRRILNRGRMQQGR